MPYKVLIGRDKRGSYARSSEKLHYKKYYFNTEIGKKRAINKAKKQIKAVLISEHKF